MSNQRRYYGIFERGTIGFHPEQLAFPHWLAAGLAAITGAIHLLLYLNEGFMGFLFAGVVFIGAIVALLFNAYRRLLYLLGIPFTAGQIVIWAAQGMPNMEIALIDKPVQVALILLLGYLLVTNDAVAADV